MGNAVPWPKLRAGELPSEEVRNAEIFVRRVGIRTGYAIYGGLLRRLLPDPRQRGGWCSVPCKIGTRS